MYLQLMYLQLMYLQLMYLQLMYLQSRIYKNIPVSFDFITTLNQGVFLCSPCTIVLTFEAGNFRSEGTFVKTFCVHGKIFARKANWVAE